MAKPRGAKQKGDKEKEVMVKDWKMQETSIREIGCWEENEKHD